MSTIAFMGLGAMGSRMASNLLLAGHTLRVWNRTASAAESLVAAGATLASSPAYAAEGADMIISMVRDDAASRFVWCDERLGAFNTMGAGAVAIESSTLSLGWMRELGHLALARDINLIEAPVSGSRPAAQAGQLVFLVGGEESVLAKVQGALQAMGSAVHHVGPLGSGALAKLATNALLGIQVTALAEITGLLAAGGADVGKTLQAIAGTPVWAPVAHYLAGSMLNGDFRPQFPVELIEKDFGYALAVVQGAAQQAPTLSAARQVFQQAMAEGLAGDNMTAVVRLFAGK